MLSKSFFGFTDILKISNTLACLNLKYISKKEANKYPCLLVNENSVFTQRVSHCKFLADQFNSLNTTPNMKAKIGEICTKIENDTLVVNVSAPNTLKKYPSSTSSSNLNAIALNESKVI